MAPAATSVSLRARTPARRDTPFKFSFVGAGMRSTHSSTPSLRSTQHSAAAAASVSSFCRASAAASAALSVFSRARL